MAPPLKRARTLKDCREEDPKGLKDLSSDLMYTVNKPENNDVTITCKDGVCVHGCKWLLSIRSPVLKKHITNGMQRNGRSKFSLEKIPSSALLSVFEYLYTGTLKSHAPPDWRMGIEILLAAKFFRIPDLEKSARDIVRNQMLNQEVTDLESHVAMDMLSAALKLQDSLKEKDELVLKLTSQLGDQWWQEDHSWNLSANAVDCLLSKRDRSRNEKDLHSLDEYLVFRWIILWHMHQKAQNNSQSEEVESNVLPIEKDVPSLWSRIFKSPNCGDDNLSDSPSNLSKLHDECAARRTLADFRWKPSLLRLLRHINWLLIPAFVLVKVVEPLHIVPNDHVLNALSFHALRSRMEFSMPDWQWRHGKSLTSDSGGKISCISENRDKQGSAIAVLPMLRSCGLYEWSFHFQVKEADLDAALLKFGFICGTDSHAWLQRDLDENYLLHRDPTKSWYISIANPNMVTYLARMEPKPRNGVAWEEFPVKLEKLSHIRFKLNVSERTCSVALSSFHALWTDLPSGVFYPAISVTCCKRAQIDISFDSGFNFLSLP